MKTESMKTESMKTINRYMNVNQLSEYVNRQQKVD